MSWVKKIFEKLMSRGMSIGYPRVVNSLLLRYVKHHRVVSLKCLKIQKINISQISTRQETEKILLPEIFSNFCT